MSYKFLLNIVISVTCTSITCSEVIDDFSNPINIGDVANSIKKITNSSGDETDICRGILLSGYSFTSDSNLHYDSSSNPTDSHIIYYTLSKWDITAIPNIRFTFSNMSQDFTGNIILKDNLGSKRTINDFNFTTQISQPIIDCSVNKTEENSSFDLSNIYKITFEMNTGNLNNLIFDLDSIEVVPEPVSTLVLGVGMGALVRKKRLKGIRGSNIL